MPRKRKTPQALHQNWFGYARRSQDREDRQVHSIVDQQKMIKEHYENLPPEEKCNRPLVMITEEDTAFHPGRVEYNKLMSLADEGKVYGVIAIQPNRISRNHYDTGAFIQRLVEGKIGCLETTLGKRYTKQDTNDIFMLTLEGAMSWKDSADKGERSRDAMRKRAKEGKIMGPAMYGYRNIILPDGTKTVEPIEGYEPKILHLFTLANTGTYSFSSLADEAWKIGLKTKTGKKLSPSYIEKILRHPIYKGWTRFDGIVEKGTHKAMVPEELWDHIQVVLATRSKPRSKPHNPQLRDLFTFGDVLSCPKCNGQLSPYRVVKETGKVYIYYDCISRGGKRNCGVRLRQEDLVKQLKQMLKSIELSEADMTDLREKLLQEHKDRNGQEGKLRHAAQREYDAVQASLIATFKRLDEAEKYGIRDEVEQELNNLKAKREHIQKRLNDLHDTGTDWIENVIRSFELFKLLQEAVIYGSERTRTMVLQAIGSNWTVNGEKLVAELRSPLKQIAQKGNHTSWWAGRDSNPRSQRQLVYSQSRLTTSVPTHG